MTSAQLFTQAFAQAPADVQLELLLQCTDACVSRDTMHNWLLYITGQQPKFVPPVPTIDTLSAFFQRSLDDSAVRTLPDVTCKTVTHVDVVMTQAELQQAAEAYRRALASQEPVTTWGVRFKLPDGSIGAVVTRGGEPPGTAYTEAFILPAAPDLPKVAGPVLEGYVETDVYWEVGVGNKYIIRFSSAGSE